MIKVSRVLRRRQGVTAEAFKAHWPDQRVSLMRQALQSCDGLLRYAQSYPLPTASPLGGGHCAEIDCVDELWCTSFDTAAALFDSPFYREHIAPHDQALIDPAASEGIAGRVYRALDRPTDHGEHAVKVVLLGVRQPRMTVHEFRRYWTDVHWKLASDSPTLLKPEGGPRRVEFCPAMGVALGGVAPSACDAVLSLWFNRAEDLKAEFTSTYYQEHLRPDESKFSDLSKSSGALTREVLVWEAT